MNNYNSSLNMGGGNPLNIIRINSINEYKSIIQNSTLNSNIDKSNFDTWHHIWKTLIEAHPIYNGVDVGHLNQDNNSNYFSAIYWHERSGYSVTNVDKIASDSLYIKFNTYNCNCNGGGSFRPIIEYKE